MVTEAERVAKIEVKVEVIETRLENIEEKLDELLALKFKGMGAIGLVSLLIGSGLIGLLVTAFDWVHGVIHGVK